MTRMIFVLAAPAMLTACAQHIDTLPIPATAPPPAAAVPPPPSPPPPASLPNIDAPAPDPMRWTYGSGEAAGASIQAWRALADYAIAAAARKPAASVPMGLPGAAGGVGTVACLGKKPAVVLDVDETVILNLGYEYWLSLGNAGGGTSFAEWMDKGAPYTAPVPGAVTGIRRLRAAGIAVLYNTNRPASGAAGTIRAIEAAGLGRAVHGEDLFLVGDDTLGSNKDGRRAIIAGRFCVVALGGDNLGDFAQALNDPALSVQQRRERSARGELAALWGNGWFMIPNAAYGFWQKGTVGDVFPDGARWQPQAQGKK